MNGSVNIPHPKTKQNPKHNLLLQGESWQHISELAQMFAEKSTLLLKSLQTNGNGKVTAFPKPFPVM